MDGGIEVKQTRETEQAGEGGRWGGREGGRMLSSRVSARVCVWTPEIHLSPAAEASLLLPDLIKNTLL